MMNNGRHTNGHDADPVSLVHFDDMRPRVTDSYLLKGLLGSASMAVIYGESGTGKTFFALHLGLSIAADHEFFGHRVRQVGVCYVAAEAGRGIENRVAACKHEIEYPEIMPFAAITVPLDLCAAGPDIDILIKTITSAQIGMTIELIFIDTLQRIMGRGNENAPDDMGALVHNIDRIRAETGAAVVLVHHSGKDASRGARGHSLLVAATDTEIEVTRDKGSKLTTARVSKQRDYPTDGTMSFSLRQVELGIDNDGDPVTSCVVEPSDDPAPSPKPKSLSPTMDRALTLLRDAINVGGEIPPANNHIPRETRCAHENVWRDYCYKGGISNGERRAKEQAFKRSADALISAGRVGKWDEWVWAN